MATRAARVAGKSLVHVSTFVVALVVAVALHLDGDLARRALRSRIQAVLAETIQGRLQIDSLGHVGLDGVDGLDVKVFDPQGKLAAAAYGVRVHVSVPGLVKSALGKGALTVDLGHVTVRALDVDATIDPDGTLGLTRAFASRTPSRPGGREVDVFVRMLDVGHAWIHGRPTPSLPVDADVDGLSASVAVQSPRITVDAPHFTLLTRGMPQRADAAGSAEAHLVMPAPGGGTLGARVLWKGKVASIDESLTASVDGEAVDAVLDVPTLSAAALRELWPASPLENAVAAHVEAKGTLPRLDLHVTTSMGDEALEVSGPVVIGPAQTADLKISAKNIDAHTLVPSAPPSRLGATMDLQVARTAAGVISGKTAIEFAGGEVASERVPAGTIKATFSKDASGPHAEATVSAREPGAPTFLHARMVPRGSSVEVSFDADTNVPRLDGIPRLGPVARGRSALKTSGRIDFEHGVMSLKAAAEVDDFGHDVMHAEHVSITADVKGKLRSPQIDVVVSGDALGVGVYKFSGAHLEVHGPASHAIVTASLDANGDGTPEVEGDGELSVSQIITIDRIHVRVVHADERVRVRVGQVQFTKKGMTIDPIVVHGLGEPLHATIESSFEDLHVKADSAGLDLARFGRVARLEEGMKGCLLKVDVDAIARRGGGDGHANFELSSCSARAIEGASAGVEANFKGRELGLKAHAELEGVGSMVFLGDRLVFGGTGSLTDSWKKLWGRVRFDGKLDLAKLATHFPAGTLPFDHVAGTVALSGRVLRESPTDATPGVILSASTRGLTLTGQRKRTTDVDGSAVVVPPAWSIEGIDLATDTRIDGETGFLDTSLRINDTNGELAALDLKSAALPYAALLDTPLQAFQLLEATPFNARLEFPERDLKTLPRVLALEGVRGSFSGVVTTSGSVRQPALDVQLKAGHVRATRGFASSLDADLAAHYEGGHGTLTLHGASGGRSLLDVIVLGNFDPTDVLDRRPGAWTASMKAHLDELPLDKITKLNDRQVSGKLSGDFTLDGLHQDARATLSFSTDELKVGDVSYPKGALHATLDGQALQADVHLDQSDGSLDAAIHAGAKWGAALTPIGDPSRPLSAQLTAHKFRGAIIHPFLEDTFSELDGRLDGDVRFAFEPSTQKTDVSGVIALSDGRFELASIGGEFHDVAGRATFLPGGAVKIEEVKASGMSGRVEAAASVRLHGAAFAAANATVLIPSASPLLLTFEGVQVGTVEGRADITATSSVQGNRMDVKVDIPTLHVGLPLTTTRDVQQLGSMDTVRIGKTQGSAFVEERLDSPRQTLAAPAGKILQMNVNFGNDVQVKKGSTLKVGLAGHPTITVSDAVRGSGQIRLLNGTIDVQGKSFNIESGTVTFVGDVTNPQVLVTASWEAPDGTVVYADYVGPLKTGKVNLRSEPALPNSEILALIVFGSPDGMVPGSESSSSGSIGAGVVGGAATQPLNRALENFGLGGVTTRVDTSSTIPRADVEVQIARDISLQIAQVMGTPPPGANPDLTLLTLNWRFIRQWSAETTVGNAGTSILDLVWQHR
ncbi:MAG TPA: translocation/assembly module TamB domain-containing protein, partial [Polyangiaceae bacterium]